LLRAGIVSRARVSRRVLFISGRKMKWIDEPTKERKNF
jgi:hypothetical protein